MSELHCTVVTINILVKRNFEEDCGVDKVAFLVFVFQKRYPSIRSVPGPSAGRLDGI